MNKLTLNLHLCIATFAGLVEEIQFVSGTKQGSVEFWMLTFVQY